jgi:hypothetical protein
MSGPAPAWVVPAMRAGYAARAVVFGLVGYLVLRAAWMGGYAEGPQEALTSLTDELLGTPLLWGIAGGAFGFAGWCLMAAALDLDRRGSDARGIFARVDFAGTGLLYIVIGVFVAELATTGVPASDAEPREEGTAWLLALPAGGWIVIALGAAFIAAGVWFGYKGLAGKYRERLRDTPVVERLDPVCKFGWTAYGFVVVILGGFLIWAGWTTNPDHAGGFAEAFALVREALFGRVLLGVLGFGFMAFAVECLVEAAYRLVPAIHGRDAPTLASRRLAARAAAAQAHPRPG